MPIVSYFLVFGEWTFAPTNITFAIWKVQKIHVGNAIYVVSFIWYTIPFVDHLKRTPLMSSNYPPTSVNNDILILIMSQKTMGILCVIDVWNKKVHTLIVANYNVFLALGTTFVQGIIFQTFKISKRKRIRLIKYKIWE